MFNTDCGQRSWMFIGLSWSRLLSIFTDRSPKRSRWFTLNVLISKLVTKKTSSPKQSASSLVWFVTPTRRHKTVRHWSDMIFKIFAILLAFSSVFGNPLTGLFSNFGELNGFQFFRLGDCDVSKCAPSPKHYEELDCEPTKKEGECCPRR